MKEEKKAKNTAVSSKMKLLYVMVVVFIVCGGNGVGLLTGAVIWRTTQRSALAVIVMLAVTLAAFGLAACLILACRHIAAHDSGDAAPTLEEEQNYPVIPEE